MIDALSRSKISNALAAAEKGGYAEKWNLIAVAEDVASDMADPVQATKLRRAAREYQRYLLSGRADIKDKDLAKKKPLLPEVMAETAKG